MTRLRIETILAVVFAVLASLTAVWPAWIEALGFEPDNGDGTAEWTIVAALGILALAAALLARRDWRRSRPAGTADV